MKAAISHMKPVLLVGNDSLIHSIAVCLLNAGYQVNLCTDNGSDALSSIHAHFSEMKKKNGLQAVLKDKLSVSENMENAGECLLAIGITVEDLPIKKDLVDQMESKLPPNAIIAINSEIIGLNAIQQNSRHPERIIGLNWTEPAHTTRFLEIIGNAVVGEDIIDEMKELAKSWNKDPYIVENFGVRSRLMSAICREAFYLVENGYASVEDIDRACRNDAGYYLPFAGNCRYMDLMGTYAYGMVMKDLNPDLSKDHKLPVFFTDIIKDGGLGMQNGKGLYRYTPEEVKLWRKIFSEFSYKIETIINKYPFNYKKKDKLA